MEDSDAIRDYLRSLKQIGTRVNPEYYDRVMKICRRDGTSFQRLLGEAIIKHIKIHEDGNQNYKLELFNDPNMVATPAFFRDASVWRKYLASLDKKRYKEFDAQLMTILALHDKRGRDLG